jgi:hypothetical protein
MGWNPGAAYDNGVEPYPQMGQSRVTLHKNFRSPLNPAPLFIGYNFTINARSARFYLDKTNHRAPARHQINLALSGPKPPGQNPITFQAQHPGRQSLSP